MHESLKSVGDKLRRAQKQLLLPRLSHFERTKLQRRIDELAKLYGRLQRAAKEGADLDDRPRADTRTAAQRLADT